MEVVSPADSAEALDKKVIRQLAGDQILDAPELLPGFAIRAEQLFEA